MIHYLKCDPKPFNAMLQGVKSFECRRDDRGFGMGDTLVLQETEYSGKEMKENGMPLKYTGRTLERRVKYTLRGEHYGILPGYVIMALGAAK